jgi:hypothetical protein
MPMTPLKPANVASVLIDSEELAGDHGADALIKGVNTWFNRVKVYEG